MIKMRKTLVNMVLPAIFIFSSSVYANMLHDAVEKNDFQKIEELLKTNPSLMQGFDKDGNTPIHLAIKNQYSASLQAFMKYKKIINPQIVNTNGDTPLVFSIKNKKYDALLYMLDGGFNPFYTDSNGKDSFDYVRMFGDNTIKEIYNDYYSRNRNRIEQLKQMGKQGAVTTPSVENKPPVSLLKNNGKPQTVADLLLNNSKRKGMAEVGSAEPDSLDDSIPDEAKQMEDTKVKLNELSNKIANLKTDRALIASLQEQVKNLDAENKQLKSQLNFKQELGRDYLTEQEKLVANSKYAPIYQQQVFYENSNPSIQNAPIIEDMSESSIIPNDMVDQTELGLPDVKDFKTDGTLKINEIEQQLPVLNGEVSKQIKESSKTDKALLPLDTVPENQAVTQPVSDKSTETPLIVSKGIQTEALIDTEQSAKVSVPAIEKELIKKEDPLKLNITVNEKEEFAKRFTSDKVVLMIVGLISLGFICMVGFLWISFKEFKAKKNKILKEKSSKSDENKEEDIVLTDKDRI